MGIKTQISEVLADICRLAVEVRQREYATETATEGQYSPEPPPPDAWDGYRDSVDERLQATFEIFFDANRGAFEALSNIITGGDGSPDGVVGALVAARNDHISTVQATVNAHWTGDARDFFRDNFLNRLATKAEYQAGYALELARVARAYEKVLDKALVDALHVAKSVRARLRELNDVGADFTLSDAFTVVGIVVSVAFPGAPAIVGGGVALAGFMSSIEERDNDRTTPEDDREYAITGDKVIDVLDSMDREVNRLLRAIGVQEQVIGEDLTDDIALFDGDGRDDFVVDHANVAGDFDLAEFTPTELTVSVDDLYKAGFIYLPAAAYDYHDARTRFAGRSGSEPLAFADWFGDTYRLWRGACQRLDGVLSATSNRLMDAGDALCEIAIHYAEQEGRNSEELETIGNNAADVFRSEGDHTLNDPPPPPPDPNAQVPVGFPP